jgi:hypothetical protein
LQKHILSGNFPPDEITIVCPPSEDPEADPNKYWLLIWTLNCL